MEKNNNAKRDLHRDVWNLFGLPVDNLTMESTKFFLRECIARNDKVVLSTINVNWIVQSFTDSTFRRAIINSDLVTLDGKPLVWLAKLLGYPMRETVSGSSLIHELLSESNTTSPFTIFLFGGDNDVAAKAMERINNSRNGLRAVGALNPGFGSVEQMSSEDIIETINKTNPDILLVALGAKKGTQWIEHNRNRLKAKIISHLGATINFLAGTVQRAPNLMIKTGTEWIWRILQEPKLFIRYAKDGLYLMQLVASRFLPYLRFISVRNGLGIKNNQQTLIRQIQEDKIIFTVGKSALITDKSYVRELFADSIDRKKDMVIDFKNTIFADGAFMGLLSILKKHQYRQGKDLVFANVNNRLAKSFSLFFPKFS